MTFSAILATTKEGVYGTDDNRLPWYSTAEMSHFVSKTRNKTVVLGRNTWNPLYFPLKNRKHIVLSTTDVTDDTKEVYGDLDTLLQEIDSTEEIMIIGGGTIYELFIFSSIVDTIHMSIMDRSTKLRSNAIRLPFQFQFTEKTVRFRNYKKDVFYTIEKEMDKDGFTYYELKYRYTLETSA